MRAKKCLLVDLCCHCRWLAACRELGRWRKAAAQGGAEAPDVTCGFVADLAEQQWPIIEIYDSMCGVRVMTMMAWL